MTFRVRSLACFGGLLSLTFGGVAAAQPLDGWTLYSPFSSGQTHLLDINGQIVHTWLSGYTPGASVYLVDDGALLHTSKDTSVGTFGAGGRGGRIERIAWDGTVEWSYVLAGTDHVQHHDIALLPSGNILAIVWERHSAAEAIAMGRDPSRVGDEVWSEAIYEIEPDGPTGGNVVWEWRVWDHLVQDFDPNLPNYGDPADHPERIDINFGPAEADWLHWNAIAYNAAINQIVISSREFSEIWIISRDPGHSGELLYRWGNPAAYGRGTVAEQKLFFQHDPEWIPEGYPGAGNLTIFNNGNGLSQSSVVELDTGVSASGTYTIPASGPIGPVDFASECSEIDGQPFESQFMSGVQRLSNGNSLICISGSGQIVEVDELCNSVWSYDAGGVTFRATRIPDRDPRLRDLVWCYADCDGSGSLDVFDFICFQDAFVQENGSADCDENGVFDVFDFLCFQDAFAAGCP